MGQEHDRFSGMDNEGRYAILIDLAALNFSRDRKIAYYKIFKKIGDENGLI